MVTDYDCWREDEEQHVSTDAVIAVLKQNVEEGRGIIREAAATLPEERQCDCPNALAGGILTAPGHIPPEALERLRPIIGKYVR